MMKTITHFFSSSGGARRSFASSALFILMSFLMLLPGVARAEDGNDDVTLSLVDASPTGESGKSASNLFDDNTSTDWYFKFASSAYVIFKASKAIVVDGYTITSGSHRSFNSDLNPLSWTLSASNDLKNWTVIGHVNNDNTLQDKNSTPSDFVCMSNTTFYKYFKWEITEGTFHVEISEFSLKQKDATCSGHQIEKMDAKAATCVDLGNIEYYKCSICQQAFKDEAGTDAYTDDSYILAATGHAWQGDKCSTCGIGALKYTETDEGVTITGFEKGYSTTQLAIPATIDNKPVVVIGSSAFFYNASIESVVIPSSVQAVGDFAFGQCTSLTSVTFAADSKLKNIGKSAFYYTKLSNMEIPSSVKKIGTEAFFNCDQLSAVTFPSDSKLEVIGEEAFGQTKLSQIEIPSLLKEIGAGAFLNCDKLSSITFASNENLKQIGNHAFMGCQLSSIDIPTSVETIGESTFFNAGLTSVTFATNSNLKTIGEEAFGSNNFSSMEFPASLATIGNETFAYCYSLTSVTFCRIPIGDNSISGYSKSMFSSFGNLPSINVPAGCAEIYKAQFSNYADKIQGEDIIVDGLKYAYNLTGDGLICKGFSGDVKQDLVIPETAQGLPVTAIGEGAFKEKMLTSVTIPASIEEIGKEAFASTSVQSVSFAENGKLKTIGEKAFYDNAIESLNLPASVETIGGSAVYNCESLTSITFNRIPMGENSISGYSNEMFSSTDKLSTINVPSGCENAYKTQLNLGDDVTVNGQDIVDNGLKYAVNTTMDGFVCKGFSGDELGNLVIPETVQGMPVTGIGASAFWFAVITSVTIPASVEEIGMQAFDNSHVNSVSFAADGKLKTIGQRAFADTPITVISIPASVVTIGECAFERCSALSSITFAEEGKLETIGWKAFGDTGITSIRIPASVKEIGESAFNNCLFLSSVTFPENGKLETIGERAFMQTSLREVHIPASVIKIGMGAFASNGNLSSISFEENGNLNSISMNAFSYTSLSRVSIPASVETIERGAFSSCPKLETVIFNRSLSEGDISLDADYFYGCGNLKTIYVPWQEKDAYVNKLKEEYQDKVKGLLEYQNVMYEVNDAADGTSKELACIGSSGMGETDLFIYSDIENMPVTEIKENAFKEDKLLTKVYLGDNFKKIGSQAFAGCDQLRRVDMMGDKAIIEQDAFHDAKGLENIVVQSDNAYSFYKNQGFENADKLVVYMASAYLKLADEKGLSEETNPSLYHRDRVSYRRKVNTTDGEYATVCLPFNVDLSKTTDVFDKVYVPLNTMIHDQANSDDTNESFILMLKEQAADAKIPANQPFIVKLKAGKDEFTFTYTETDDVRVSKDMMPSEHPMTVLDWDGASGLMTENTEFNISYSSHYKEPFAASADMGIWSSTAQGTFGPQTDGNLNPFRLFLHVDGVTITPAKAYSIRIGVNDDSTATGIREIISADANNGASSGASVKDGIIYDLNGQKVATAAQAKSLPKGIYIQNGRKLVINN